MHAQPIGVVSEGKLVLAVGSFIADKERPLLGTSGLPMARSASPHAVSATGSDTVDTIALLKEYASREMGSSHGRGQTSIMDINDRW